MSEIDNFLLDKNTEGSEDLEGKDDDDGLAEDDVFKDEDLGDFDGLGDSSISPMEKHNDLLKDLTNFDPFIKSKVNGWLGLVWNSKNQNYEKDPEAEPIMNYKCANWCIDFLKVYTRNNNIITNIDRESYGTLVYDIIDVLWLNIGTRAEEFEIKNNGDILKICVELQHSAELVLMGAGGGEYNKLLSTVTNRSETVNLSQQGPQAMGYGYEHPQVNNRMKPGGFINNLKQKLTGR